MTDLIDRKLDYWEHRLLDLGKRNRMINYRQTSRSTLRIVEPSFDELYRRIQKKEDTLTFKRAIDRETDVRVWSVLSLLELMAAPLEVTIGDIGCSCGAADSRPTLKNLRAKARLALEEQGTNILYLSFGFIEWRDGAGTASQTIRSPLILVPVKLSLDALNSPYKLSRHEDDTVLNPTLEYYLRTEHGIELPPFDAEHQSPDDYLMSLEEIADKRGWRIIREVSLGLLSFLKITMYNDLQKNRERIKNNPVIRALAGDTSALESLPDPITPLTLDSISAHDCYQVMSADSSQQEAIQYSKKKISFVMQGPPGTGKSQTIANMIAEALAEGKKVLFVSEKMAALQVVYRRLEDANLAEFCLPLHSYKANKKEILEQIGANLELPVTHVRDTAITSLDELSVIRAELNAYATELHKPCSELGITVYEAYTELERLIDAPTVTFAVDDPFGTTHAKLSSYKNALKAYASAVSAVGGNIGASPWQWLCTRVTGHEYTDSMRRELESAREYANACRYALGDLLDTPLSDAVTAKDIGELKKLLMAIAALPKLPAYLTDASSDLTALYTIAEAAEKLYRELADAERTVNHVFTPDIYTYDADEWRTEVMATAKKLVDMPLNISASADYVVENATSLYRGFTELAAKLDELCGIFSEISVHFGISVRPSVISVNALKSLADSLTQDSILIKPELAAALIVTLKKARAQADSLAAMEAELLSKWEDEILTLNYSPLLLRFKTDYTSVFKLLNPQYHSDKRKLQALSLTVITKLTDEQAANLLFKLKAYHDAKNAFDGYATSLSALGTLFCGRDTDWERLELAVSSASELSKMPEDMLSDRILTLLREDFTSNHSVLVNYCLKASEAISVIDTLVKSCGISSNVNSQSFDAYKTKSDIAGYISVLSHLCEYASKLAPYLQSSNESIEHIYSALEKLDECRSLRAVITERDAEFSKALGELYVREKTDWESVKSALTSLGIVRSSALFPVVMSCIGLNENIRSHICDTASSIDNISDNGSLSWLDSQFLPEHGFSCLSVAALCKRIDECIAAIDTLRSYTDYREAREACSEIGLAGFVHALERSKQFDCIEASFLKGFWRMWIGAACDRLQAVRRFRRVSQDERIDRFTELDDRQLLIAQMRLREKLTSAMPSQSRIIKATDELAVLNKELAKKRNIMPLRKLFRRIPDLLQCLKPCFMMSPLSVSYFLEAEAYHFDLVIFDEASQIFTEDAIGAIFRADRVIIAGDTNQLPPTDFFAAATNSSEAEYDSDEDDYYDCSVSDSILEEAAAVLPSRTLKWHYRSKHESLIAFSNREIYGGSLITFPENKFGEPDCGVEYIYVEDGIYEGGGRNRNMREAEKCVELVRSHIENHPERSLGIIAFSEKQQNAIESAITEFRRSMPRYEWFFDETRDEPFFIKNLENVQGDERDTIIFSICYAKDRNGKMYMRFGPLGVSGGERRLNVAVTRAKCNIKLVGSIMPTDIDLTRTESVGARMLRSYIEFAMRGGNYSNQSNQSNPFAETDGFVDYIAKFLETNGYRTRLHLGASDYKLDIAVEHPDNPGEYIAAIECDGLSYISAGTARDRDHLRRTVLCRMGWRLYRVWSTEWSRDPQKEGKALLEFLASLTSGIHTDEMPKVNTCAIAEIVDDAKIREVMASDDNPYGFSYYEEAHLDQSIPSGNDNITAIAKSVQHVVTVESPIHAELLYKRISPVFESERVTDALRCMVRRAINERLAGIVNTDEHGFIHSTAQTSITARIPRNGSTPRVIEHIHPSELDDAMLTIVKRTYGITVDELCSQCSRALGYSRRTAKLNMAAEASIERLTNCGSITVIDNKVRFNGGRNEQ